MKILLIDDNSTISMTVKALLQKYAYIKEEERYFKQKNIK